MKYHFKIHRQNNGFWAECVELKGCHTDALNMKGLVKNMEEALNLYLDEPKESDVIFSLPDERIKSSKNIQEVQVKPEVAVAFLLRNLRLKNQMSQRQFAKALGFKNLYSYQRLEKSGNPELKTLVMIKKKFPEIPLEKILD